MRRLVPFVTAMFCVALVQGQALTAVDPAAKFAGTWKSTLKGELLSRLDLTREAGKLAGSLAYPDEWDDEDGVITAIGSVFNGTFDQERLIKSLVMGNTAHLVFRQYGDTDVVEADFVLTGKDTAELKFLAPGWLAYLKPWKFSRENSSAQFTSPTAKLERFAGGWQATWNQRPLYQLELALESGNWTGSFVYPDTFRANPQGEVVRVDYDDGTDESNLVEAKPFGSSLILKFMDEEAYVIELEMVMNGPNQAEIHFLMPPPPKRKLNPATFTRVPG